MQYHAVDDKSEGEQLAPQQAYVLTEIENRPIANFNIPHPPLQTVYPKSIQNNVESLVASPLKRLGAASIPMSLPSIVHDSSNTVATIENVPSTFTGALKHPVITSTYSNRESDSREKVVVKVVKAPGWYLNDVSERNSYFDAVAHGLLSENGLVYVNNVQKENIQNAPIPVSGTNVLPPGLDQPSRFSNPAIAYSPKSILPPALLQSQAQYSAGNLVQPFNGFWPPCANTAFQQSIQLPAQLQHSTFKKRSTNADLFDGRSSYDVGQQSVGRLAGDNARYQYNLSSLRNIPPRLPPQQTQSTF